MMPKERGRPVAARSAPHQTTVNANVSVSELLTAALGYAAAGWEVFPLARDKSPAFRSPHADPAERAACKGRCGRPGHGFYDATRDPARIRAWWTARPYLLIAARVPANLFMLDVDPRGGGLETLERIQAEHGPLPETLTCFSGRGDGGRHLYFVRPPGVQLSAHRLPGIDLCHHGLRYAVLPPSPHPKTGQPYRWADPQAPVAYPPLWLVRLLLPRPTQPARPRQRRGRAPTDASRLARWVASRSPEPGTGRHDAVLWALCVAYEAGGDAQVIAEIKAAARAIGKPDDEIERMDKWAATHAHARSMK